MISIPIRERMVHWQSQYILAFTIMFLVLNGSGCQNSEDGDVANNNNLSTNVHPDLTANEIWEETQRKYAETSTYQDDAVLKLNYRLDGQWIEEYHPLSFAFQRNRAATAGSPDSFHAKIFNSRFSCDAERMTCFVFDSPTGNLDNQVMLQHLGDETGWEKFVNDPIANYFVSGNSELPLESSPNSKVPVLFPVTIGLITGKSKLNWMFAAEEIVRLADATIEFDNDRQTYDKQTSESKYDCFALEFHKDNRKFHVYIDQKTLLIRRIIYPESVLSSVLNDAIAVSNILLKVDFQEARTNDIVDSELWATELSEVANPVRKFVKLPEAFPSEIIGRPLPGFELQTFGKARIPARMLRGQTTSMLIVDASVLQTDALDRYIDVANREFNGGRRFAVSVCGAPEAANALARELESRSRKISVFIDPEFTSCRSVGAKQLPAVIIADKATIIHYFKQIGNEPWLDEFVGAFKRIDRGDDVATEMHRDYKSFLEQYHQKLASANPFQTKGKPLVRVTGATATKPQKSVVTVNWKTKLTQPGELFVETNFESNDIFVLDGWQTIVQLDQQGRQKKDVSLPVPKNTAIQRIQRQEIAGGREVYLCFNPGDQRVHVFDDKWEPLLVYPKSSQAITQESIPVVRDALVAKVGADVSEKLFVLFSEEVHEVNLQSGIREDVTDVAQGASRLGLIPSGGGGWLLGVAGPNRVDVIRESNSSPIRLSGNQDVSVRVFSEPTDSVCIVGTSSARLGQGLAQINSRGIIDWNTKIDGEELDWVAILRSSPIDVRPNNSNAELSIPFWIAIQPGGSIVLVDDSGGILDQFSIFSEGLCEKQSPSQEIRAAYVTGSSTKNQLLIATGDTLYSFDVFVDPKNRTASRDNSKRH